MDTRQEVEGKLEQSVTPIECDHRYSTVSRQVILRAMGEIPVLFSTQLASIIVVVPQENIAKDHASMTAKGTVDVYAGRFFFITIKKSGRVHIRNLG